MKKILPSLIEEKGLKPDDSYLVSGNSGKTIDIISIQEDGLRRVSISSYLLRKLSIFNHDQVINYQDIEYALAVPRFNIDFIFKEEIPKLLRGEYKAVVFQIPWTYRVNDHRLFNFFWPKGDLYREIIKKLKDNGVEVKYKQSTTRAKRQLAIILVWMIVVVIVTWILVMPQLDYINSVIDS